MKLKRTNESKVKEPWGIIYNWNRDDMKVEE